MGLIKGLSALLFACVLVALAYGGLWFLSLKVTEKQFATLLSSHLGVTASYDAPEWLPVMTEVAVRLPNVSVRVALPEDARLVLAWPEVELHSAYFGGDDRLTMVFPQKGYAELIHGGKRVAMYDIVTSGNELILMPERVQWQTFIGKISRGDDVLYAWKDGMVVWQTPKDVPHGLSVQAKEVDGVVKAASFQLEAEVNNLDKMGAVNWALGLQPEKARLKLWLNRMVATLQQGGQVQVKRFSVRQNNFELDGNGGLTIGFDGVPRGEITLQAKDGKQLADLIVKSRIAAPNTAEEVMRYGASLDRLRAEDATPLAKIVLHQGVAIINAQRVGRVPSATTMVDGWF